MNLIELSEKINKPMELLKEEIIELFGIIILSEYNPVNEIIVRHYIGTAVKPNKNTDKQDTGKKSEVNKGQNNIDELQSCLDELNNIINPEIAYTKKLLKYCIDKKYLIFIDTCSLLNDNFDDFYKLYISQKGNSDIRLYIPYVVTEELKKIATDNRKEKELSDKAIRILMFISEEEVKQNIFMVGNESDKRTNEHGKKVIHADRVIIEKLIFFRNDARSSLFITQDFDATVDALKQNDWHSSKSSALILVKKIIKGGALADNTKETVNPRLPIDK